MYFNVTLAQLAIAAAVAIFLFSAVVWVSISINASKIARFADDGLRLIAFAVREHTLELRKLREKQADDSATIGTPIPSIPPLKQCCRQPSE